MGEWFGEAGGEHPEVVPYEPSWPARFDEIAASIGRCVPGATGVDHIGSTAVPGLAAKPVIDVQIVVRDLEDEAAYRPGLEALGIPLRAREVGRRFFRPPAGSPRTAHIHVVAADSQLARDTVGLRDYLRAHDERRDAYARLKLALSNTPGMNRGSYQRGKAQLVLALIDEARQWAAHAADEKR